MAPSRREDQNRSRSTERKANSGEPRTHKNRKTGETLVSLDNPDDGEIYETGDAADFAGQESETAPNPEMRRKERRYDGNEEEKRE